MDRTSNHMKTLHQLHNEEQAEAFQRDSEVFVRWLHKMDRDYRRLEMLSVVLKMLFWGLFGLELVIFGFYLTKR